MIAELKSLVEFVEDHLDDDIDATSLATSLGTTEYHLRRMFSSLAGMPLSEYVRRRRMSVAAADVLGDEDLLRIAVRYGYGSTEAFGRAFGLCTVWDRVTSDEMAAPFELNHRSGSA